ncbi:TobH protein [Mycolicibacterium monacense]|uniref:TobH protein n=1 Tax=Mycolicibacterium monacense TaxID=85693 RepID=UPI0009F24AF3|nr:TobH protein [Mycolicibacterium monacense]MDA4104062.1 TobH protein [Mycolicibacterium monacense DSM 44395]ORB23290.1 TobH protein [Mycolicibacterium monacense DSM 44395]QHP85156.1 TobH protein [Mycolicibacterium monacense DSM 44395]
MTGSSAAVVDLDDGEALLAADRDGLLRAAAMAGAQVRATAAALDEGLLESLRSGQLPRTVIWVAGRGTAETAGAVLAAAFGAVVAAPIVTVAEAPPWIGALDVIVLAGDDPADPALVAAAATGVRRGARVVVVAPYEGPLRDATAGRAVALAPRLWVPDDFGLSRYLAAGLAVLQVVAPGLRVDLGELADELDAEALRNSAARELVTNPAKALAERMSGRDVVLAGDNATTLALARHGAAVLLRVAQETVAAVGLGDVLVALRSGFGAAGSGHGGASLFHDEELDGPLPRRARTFVLTTEAERPTVTARVSGYDDLDLVNAEDVPDGPEPGGAAAGGRGMEQQLAKLAVRLEMTAVYLRLVRG